MRIIFRKSCFLLVLFLSAAFLLGPLALLGSAQAPPAKKKSGSKTASASEPGANSDEKQGPQQLGRVVSTSPRAKEIFNRAKVLAARVIAVSKGAKGVGEPITKRSAWKEIAKSPAFSKVIEEAETLQREEIPLPTEEDYMLFCDAQDKGYSDLNREYEDKYNRRRHRLERLVLAECFENKGRFLMDIEEIISVICYEPCWCTPWHDREAKRFKGEDLSINFQMARTAWNLATADYWLGRKLSPAVRDMLRVTIAQRVLAPYEYAILTDKYELINWANHSHFDNANCHAAIVGAALALIDSAELRSQYIAAAEYNVEKFLKVFSRDGYFPDGVWAWNEGYGSFILMAEIMHQATDGRIDMFKRPNIKETAFYGAKMEITPGVYEAFGNRWRNDRPAMFPPAFISKRFKMGLTEIEDRAPFFGIGPGPLYLVGIFCFPNSSTLQKGEPAKKEIVLPVKTMRSEFPLNGVMILRSGKGGSKEIGVQLKGGNNNEPGNHSDLGTYVVSRGGGIPLIDIGGRYNRHGLEITDHMLSNFVNSFGHPVPRIDEMLQRNGPEAICPLISREYTDTVDKLEFDLAYAYPWKEPKDIKEMTRTFIYDRTGNEPDSKGMCMLTVIDKFRSKKPFSFENCLITFGPFKLLTEEEDATTYELIIDQGDRALHVTVSNEVVELSEETKKYVKQPKPLVFESGVLEEPLVRAPNSPLRLSFGFETPIDEVVMTVKIRPALKNERDLAKNDPNEPMRVYTSPIDEQALMADVKSGTGDVSEEAMYIQLFELIKAGAGEKRVARFKNMSVAEIKPQLNMLQSTVPSLRELANYSDEELEELIQMFKDYLDGKPIQRKKSKAEEGTGQGEGEDFNMNVNPEDDDPFGED